MKRDRWLRRWLKTTGTVTRSTVRAGWKASTGPALLNLDWLCEPDITYGYQVDGKTYAGSRVSLATIAASYRPWAEKTAGRYPVGRTVDVWYAPANPGDCVLARGIAVWALLLMGLIGASCLALGTLAALHVMAF